MGLFSRLFGKKKTESADNGVSPPGVVHVASDDERMNWAIEKARLTLDYFRDSLLNPRSGQSYFAVKVKITDQGEDEYIWLTTPSFDEEGNLFGVVGNKPQFITTVKENQEIGIDADHIADWMILENERLIGGYTIRAIRDGLQENEVAGFDKSTGLHIDEGVDYFPHDFSTPEGAILCLEDAYDEKDVEKAIACKDFSEEARMLLKRMNDLYQDGDIVDRTAEILELSFRKSLEENGFPVFKNLLHAFPVRQKISRNLYLITEVCIFPDGSSSRQQLYTHHGPDGWRVLHLAD
jgi:uncharacterized protein YegJ (DUF2314 family)